MKKERGLRVCVVMLIFVLTLGAWLFYLRYEGVTKYQYVLPSSPDLSLTVENAEEIITAQETDTGTGQDQTLLYKPQIPVSVIKVVYSQMPEESMSARVRAVSSDNGNATEVTRTRRNRIGDNEILFAFPQTKFDEIYITVHGVEDIKSIDMYQYGAHIDTSKVTPHRLNACIAFLLAALFVIVYLAAEADLLKGKNLGFSALYFVLEWAVVSFCLQTRSYESYSYGVEIVTYLIFTLVTVVLCMVYRMLFIWHSPIHWVYAISAMTMGIIMMLLIQPYAAPDEQTHFYQAYIRANRILGSEDLREIRWDDVRFQEKQLGLYDVDNSYERYVSTAADFKLINEDTGMKKFTSSELQSVPLGYVVTGAAVAAARILNLSGSALFYLGRFMSLLAFVMLITLAIYLIPFGKVAIMCIAAAPVCMQLAAAYSYDPIVTAFAFLYVAYVLRLWAQEKDISLRQYMVCMGLAMLLAPSKIAYAPMTAAIFLIPKSKYAFGGKYKWAINFSVVAGAFACLLLMQQKRIGAASAEVTIEWAGGAQGYSLLYLITNIKETINLYMYTFQTKLDWFIEYLFCENLGWHQLNAAGWLTPLFCILFFVGSQRVENESKVCCTPGLRWGVIIVIAMSGALTMLSMLLLFTPIGSDAIAGVQGRYFIPIMILFIPVLRSMQIQVTEKTNQWCSFAVLWASLYAAISLLQVMPA